MYSISIDIGQSGSRAAVINCGRVRSTHAGLPGYASGRDLADRIGNVLTALDGIQGVSSMCGIDAVTVGTTGMWGHVPELEDVARYLGGRFGALRLRVADDALTAMLGALGSREGVVLAAGTGVVGLGRGPLGVHRVDGVGSMIGDQGSGWWIGRKGIIAALSAVDRRPGGSTALLVLLEKKFASVRDIPRRIAEAEDPVRIVAEFATSVAVAAREGDPVACAIWHRAGQYLADDVIAAAAGSGLDDPEWCIVGQIGQARDLLMESVVAGIREAHPGGQEVEPGGDPLAGTVLLDALPTCEDLAPLVRETHEVAR